MAQNIYDNPDFFAGYRQLARQTQGLDGAPEWPMMRDMLPDLRNKRILDLGCGFGWAARYFRDHGAASALGVDLSQNMIDLARQMTADAAIDYRIDNLETLELPVEAFDLVFSSLAFHYVEDFIRLAEMISSCLTPGGHLVFSIEHPIFMAAERARRLIDDAGRAVWPISRYAMEGQRRTDWFVEGVVKYHRRMATTINALLGASLVLKQIEEFAPTPAQIAVEPALEKELGRPMFLLIAATKNHIVR